MRIATFNLESLDTHSSDGVPLEARIAILRPQLERLRADILCLQEVNGQRVPAAGLRSLQALDLLLEGTPYEAYARAFTTGPGGTGVADVHNLVTLSRWPFTSTRQVQNDLVPAHLHRCVTARPPGPEPMRIGFERPILICDVTVPGGPEISIVNLHLRAPLASPIPGQKEGPFAWKSISGWAEGYALSAWKRTAQALEARLVVEQLYDERPSLAVVLAGDFNAEDHETPLRILAGADEDTGNGRLAVRSLVVVDRSIAQDRRFSTLHHGRPQMLDHILVGPPLLARLLTVEVHNESLCDEIVGFGKTRYAAGSYHAPLVAEFTIP